MENLMFCYQCEQTLGGKGCTKSGVCGKTPEIANLQDLLIYQIKGISCYAKALIEEEKTINIEVIEFVENSLFTTLTNVNFDAQFHIKLLLESQRIKENLRKIVQRKVYREEALYNLSRSKEDMLKDSIKANIMYNQELDPDIRSLRSTILYGLKGISAYGHQARFLGYNNEQVDNFYFLALESTTNDNLSLEDMIRMTLRCGDMSIAIMKVLDEANTTKYKDPVPTKVNVNIKKGPFIIVSGHDLKDLEILLKQTEGKGINIYSWRDASSPWLC